MTEQSLFTIIAPLAPDRLDEARFAIDRLGNPARESLTTTLDIVDEDGSGTHFVSLHAFAAKDSRRAFLLLECSADGAVASAIDRLVKAIGESLGPIFALADDWEDRNPLETYLQRHVGRVGQHWSDPPGLTFAGMPGSSVQRIRDEARLASVITELLARQGGGERALDRLEEVRRAIAASDLKDMLEPTSEVAPFQPQKGLPLIAGVAVQAIRFYLWPIAAAVLFAAVVAMIAQARFHASFWPVLEVGGKTLLASVGVALLATLVLALILYTRLRALEETDYRAERTVDAIRNRAMFDRENHLAQNHMISITHRKPGLVRAITLRLVFFLIGQLAGRRYRPGFLGSIGSIHFARWVSLPGSDELVFLSNYDGSWESYLEDFITRAHAGLTGVWSNTIGFPYTKNLVGEGASDGERFKRFARDSMIPTLFWYSAYPRLTLGQIRTNAAIRRGLSGAMSEDEAALFLAQFGSAARPAEKLLGSEIQSLVFGGLGFMPFGTCLLQSLPEDRESARCWLRSVAPYVAFNDGRRLRQPAVVTLALGPDGLRRLGLGQDAVESFAFAFNDGMSSAARARILGDRGVNDPSNWQWGREPVHAVLLVYGESARAVARLEKILTIAARDCGADSPYVIALQPVAKEEKKEAFGFRDGISQPVIRGTYKGFRDADPIHLVEAGEFILGYPDNRGHVPPGPSLPAIDDPGNLLPTAGSIGFDRTSADLPRSLGANGTYLVIRELEQDVEGFENYCEVEAARLASANRLRPPYVPSAEFIAAKLVGRWRDGSSLARFPYESRTDLQRRLGHTAISRPPPAATGLAGAIPPPPGHSDEDNDFLFGAEDPEALRCPFGAHIRRANPRDSFDPGSADQIAITNRHRIIRVGRNLAKRKGGKPGLLFMCLNGDLERQFEFLQQSWLTSSSFHALSCEKDPLLGDAEEGVCRFTVPTRDGPVSLNPLPRFVTVRGGGYFFVPSKRLLEFLQDS